jgi:hypothetical protein
MNQDNEVIKKSKLIEATLIEARSMGYAAKAGPHHYTTFEAQVRTAASVLRYLEIEMEDELMAAFNEAYEGEPGGDTQHHESPPAQRR